MVALRSMSNHILFYFLQKNVKEIFIEDELGR